MTNEGCASTFSVMVNDIMLSQRNDLVPLPATPCKQRCAKAPMCKANNQEKESEMYTDKDIETRQRDHMLRRAEKVCYAKEADAAKTFHLTNDDYPQTFVELKARIEAGKYVLDEKQDAMKYGPLSAVTWRDPATPEDRPGFEAWQVLLKKSYVNTKDQIIVLPVTDGLKALQAFEAETIH